MENRVVSVDKYHCVKGPRLIDVLADFHERARSDQRNRCGRERSLPVSVSAKYLLSLFRSKNDTVGPTAEKFFDLPHIFFECVVDRKGKGKSVDVVSVDFPSRKSVGQVDMIMNITNL